jgi:cell shape-determining protein MreC
MQTTYKKITLFLQLSENPLLHLEKIKQKNKQISSESSETDLLERTITEMAMLLQVGFGCAGTEIIAKSLSIEGELDPMVPGCRVTAIFGFCDIRNFILATELLQQDVMLFVNKLAHITHSHVVASGGAPNKNIGDAFLLVWKLDCSKHGHNAKIPTHVFDAALSSIQNVISEIKQLGTLADFMQEVRKSNKLIVHHRELLPDSQHLLSSPVHLMRKKTQMHLS